LKAFQTVFKSASKTPQFLEIIRFLKGKPAPFQAPEVPKMAGDQGPCPEVSDMFNTF
jgi:hypothetical protein